MNAKTAKLLKSASRKLSDLIPTYKELKRTWYKMTPLERARTRRNLELELGR
jgi:hypothetical protein